MRHEHPLLVAHQAMRHAVHLAGLILPDNHLLYAPHGACRLRQLCTAVAGAGVDMMGRIVAIVWQAGLVASTGVAGLG